MKKLIIALAGIILAFTAIAQKKVVLMGSSTAEGWFATPGNSFFERLQSQYPAHTWVNLGWRGLTTYQALATSVAGKPPVDLAHNITAALALNPDIILVSYPTNDVNSGFTNEETINNLVTLQTIAAGEGKFIYFLGTQPRDFGDEARRTQLSTQNDLIMLTFPTLSINVYPELVRAGGYIGFDVRYLDGNNVPDGIHLNDEGHRRIFQKVVDFNIFQAALPVTLQAFKGEMHQRSARLQWQTSSEVNNEYIGVERSVDGQTFREIGRLRGQGNSNKPKRYAFDDEHPAVGKNYYRLAMINRNGQKEFSRTIQLNNLVAGNLSAYPVPASEVLHIHSVHSARTQVTITVMDMTGQRVYSTIVNANKGVNSFRIPVAQLRNGMYVAMVASADGINRLSFIRQ